MVNLDGLYLVLGSRTALLLCISLLNFMNPPPYSFARFEVKLCGLYHDYRTQSYFSIKSGPYKNNSKCRLVMNDSLEIRLAYCVV
jgi:hypothetical protein